MNKLNLSEVRNILISFETLEPLMRRETEWVGNSPYYEFNKLKRYFHSKLTRMEREAFAHLKNDYKESNQ